jgi:hypothetical protein
MVCGGGYVETDKRISDVNWEWAVKQVEDVVNDRVQRLENDHVLTFAERELLKLNIRRAWARILVG